MDFDAAGPAAEQPIQHWYDFICPFCYIAQARNAALRAYGARLTARPYEAHPETPRDGLFIGPRSGAMYDLLETEARAAGLELRWPPRLPNSHLALSTAAWIEAGMPAVAATFETLMFAAHFERGEDIGDVGCIGSKAVEAGVDRRSLDAALADGTAEALLLASTREGRRYGVRGTPAWLIHGRLVSGLLSKDELLAILRNA